MKIPVFGAGVLGCNLARGSLAEGIQKNGLRIKDKFSPRMCCSLSMPPLRNYGAVSPLRT